MPPHGDPDGTRPAALLHHATGHGDFAALFDGVDGIEQQIDEDLSKLGFIRLHLVARPLRGPAAPARTEAGAFGIGGGAVELNVLRVGAP